ncbi:MAG TPA: HEAT repeat domain-containing protein [Planctomycetota bacterium]|nr:HEAT repeat domain-containing protein [Planctomycetota bacterium]
MIGELGLAILLLAPQEDVDPKLKAFAEAMKAAKTDAERIAAIGELAAVRHLKAAQKLAAVVGGPYTGAVRAAAAEGVGKIGDPKSGPGLQAILSSYGGLLSSENPNRADDQKSAEAIVRALGAVRDRSAVKMLTGLLISNNIPLMAEACRTLGKLRDPSCLEGLLKLHYAANSPETGATPNPRKPLAPDTLAALKRITGQNFSTPDEWNKWYKTVGRAFVPPPEESMGGMPFDVRSFAVYSGKGESAALAKYDLVFLDAGNYQKSELAGLKAIALSGEPKAALDKGFAGVVVEAAKAAEARRKHPRALLVCREADVAAAPHLNAYLVDSVEDAQRLKDARVEAAIWVLIGNGNAEKLKAARDRGFAASAAPDAAFSTLAPLN